MKKIALLLTVLAFGAHAEKLKNTASFSWDKYPKAEIVEHFVLQCCPPGQCRELTINSGFAVAATMTLPATDKGDASCMLTAHSATETSPPSNTVIWDRTAPAAPSRPRVIEY